MPIKKYVKMYQPSSPVRDIISNNKARNYFKEFLPEVYDNHFIFERIIDKKFR